MSRQPASADGRLETTPFGSEPRTNKKQRARPHPVLGDSSAMTIVLAIVNNKEISSGAFLIVALSVTGRP